MYLIILKFNIKKPPVGAGSLESHQNKRYDSYLQIYYIITPLVLQGFILLYAKIYYMGSDIMITAIYARQSIDKKDSISIETQIDLCQNEIPEGTPSEVYIDKGFSGKNTDRPSFRRLMADVERGKIDNIVVYRLDRISRSVVDFANIIDILNKHNVGFVSANEKFDTSAPAGKAMLYIIMVFAQMERETLAERIKDNYYSRGSLGVWCGGPAPFGFDNAKIMYDGKKVSTIVPNKDISLITRIFEEYAADGATLGSIAAVIAKERGEMWNNIKLSRMLHNPAYVRANADIYNYYASKGCIMKNDITDYNGDHGLNLYGKRNRTMNKYRDLDELNVTVSLHKGVVSPDLFLRCQYKLDKNIQLKNSGKGSHTWLTGLVKCGLCGRALVVYNYKSKHKTTKYFKCSGKGQHLCAGLPTVYVDEVEKEIGERIKKHAADLQSVRIKTADSKNDNEINALKISLAKIEEEIKSIVDNLSFANETLVRYANEKISALDAQKKDLLGKITALSAKTEQSLNVPDLTDWNIKDFDFKKSVAHILIEKILIYPTEIKVFWKI